MAHVGKIYPFAKHRDWGLNTQIMSHMPLRFVIPEDSWIATSAGPWPHGDWISEEAEYDWDIGEHRYVWTPLTWGSHDISIVYTTRPNGTDPQSITYHRSTDYGPYNQQVTLTGHQASCNGIGITVMNFQLNYPTSQFIRCAQGFSSAYRGATWDDIASIP